MGQINEIAKKMLASGEVKVVIGYSEGSKGRVRPHFACNEQQASELIYDSCCTQNLAMYVYKKESASLGKPAFVANVHTLRGIIRLAAEKQIKEDQLIVLAIDNQGGVTTCNTIDEMEQHVITLSTELKAEDRELITKLDAMTPAQRWSFWENEMESCIKCYACRQACPLCYCTQCTVEINQPQWIPVAANTQGNLEWHIMRAMHLAGRCVSCGQCGDACPVNIPIHLLPMKLAEEFRAVYGTVAGMNRQEGCAMSTYQPDDKEYFIG